jgi:hypothetical protein
LILDDRAPGVRERIEGATLPASETGFDARVASAQRRLVVASAAGILGEDRPEPILGSLGFRECLLSGEESVTLVGAQAAKGRAEPGARGPTACEQGSHGGKCRLSDVHGDPRRRAHFELLL